MGENCPLCRRDMGARKPPRLYGQGVCRSCYWTFATRRHMAFLIDWFLFQFFAVGAVLLLGAVLDVTNSPDETWRRASIMELIGLAVVFCCKDGFKGYSLGKRLCGVRVVHSKTGRPSGPFASLMRNLPLVVPFMPVIVAVQLFQGQRVGDSTAGTLVMWEKYSEAFGFPEAPANANVPKSADPSAAAVAPVVEDQNPYRPPLA